MNDSIAGVRVPQRMSDHLADTKKEDRGKASIEIAASLIRKMEAMRQGVHLMRLGWDNLVALILEPAELGATHQ